MDWRPESAQRPGTRDSRHPDKSTPPSGWETEPGEGHSSCGFQSTVSEIVLIIFSTSDFYQMCYCYRKLGV